MLDTVKPVATKRYEYERMTAAEFRKALAQFGLSDGRFARLYGTIPKRVRAWAAGQEDIPHAAFVMLSLLTMPGSLEMAERVTDSVITDTRLPDTEA